MTDPILKVIRNEGGYAYRSDSSGGPIKYGIDKTTYGEYLGRPADTSDIKDMDETAAREVYERNYLTGPRIHTLDEPLQGIVLDIALHEGPLVGIKMVQKLLNAAGLGPIDIDGVLGPNTREAAQQAATRMGDVLIKALVAEYTKYLTIMAERDITRKVHLNDRINLIRLYADGA